MKRYKINDNIMNGKNRIDILCATDDNYAALCGIMLTSLFKSNRNEEIHVHIFTGALSADNQKKYDTLARLYNAEINVIEVDQTKFDNCPIWPGDHLSITAYYRLIAPLLLPDIDKVLYLDCDIIVNDSLRTLWNEDIEQKALGAVIDAEFYNEEFYERLQLSAGNLYFNSGVLLMNLKYWRGHRVMERCFECIATQREKLRWHDQDTLNVVLQNEIKHLPIRYNLQTPFLLSVFAPYYDGIYEEIMEGIKSPCIIHYIGGGKPWQGQSLHPFKSYFMDVKADSLWKNTRLNIQKGWLFESLKFNLCQVLWATGIKKRPQTYIIHPQKKR